MTSSLLPLATSGLTFCRCLSVLGSQKPPVWSPRCRRCSRHLHPCHPPGVGRHGPFKSSRTGEQKLGRERCRRTSSGGQALGTRLREAREFIQVRSGRHLNHPSATVSSFLTRAWPSSTARPGLAPPRPGPPGQGAGAPVPHRRQVRRAGSVHLPRCGAEHPGRASRWSISAEHPCVSLIGGASR